MGAGSYYVGALVATGQITISINPKSPSSTTQNPQTDTKVISSPPETPIQSTPLFTGTVKRLTEDLGFFQTDPQEKRESSYYEAGVYASGPYKGYRRIIGIKEPYGPGDIVKYVFAEKNGIVVLDDPDNYTKLPKDYWRNPYSSDIIESKITKTDSLPTEHQQIIPLNKQYALFMNGPKTDTINTGRKDTNGYDIYEPILIVDFSSFKTLSSNNKNLSFYAIPHNKEEYYPQMKDAEKQIVDAKNTFFETTTDVVVVDSTGLAYSYTLALTNQTTSYASLYQDYLQKDAQYMKDIKNNVPSPVYPQMVEKPGIRFIKKDIDASVPTYNSYDKAIPQACGIDSNTFVIKGVTNSDLQKIGAANFIDIYALTDKNHPLYKAAFNNKITDYFKDSNPDVQKPTYDNYFARYPLFFIKDFWGRWAVLGEYDYLLAGGCGKPVIYLYPEDPTDVNVSFESQMQLTTSIPTYANGWYVKAYPDGTLVDLKLQATDCNAIDVLQKGSEYAKKACVNNTYPYLYWAGQSLEKKYPKITEGWIVEKKNLLQFMNTTLTTIGLTEKEKNDMMEYWMPEMLGKNTPYYRISFLQTQDMNKLAPMHISPQPDSVYRIFLDYIPLVSAPNYILQPKKLEPIVRKGFTVVEWGGLKK